MYGRGNYAPQFGQPLQRPIPPYQQQPAVHPSAQHFQSGNSVPLQPVMQQGGTPHGVPPRGPAYLHAPPAPPSLSHQGPQVSTSNSSQPYIHPPLTVHSGGPPQLPYLASQQNFISGTQNPHPPPPPSMGPPRVQPPLAPYMHLPPPLPPPTVSCFFPPANFESAKQQAAESHMSTIALPPPPLPPSSPPRAPPPPLSCSPSSPGKFSTLTDITARSPIQLGDDPTSEQVLVAESSGNIANHSQNSGSITMSDEDMSFKKSVLMDVPPPPPKPQNENVVRNIEVLCQFIAKNGPEFEEMARKNESGNPEFNFLVGGDLGSEASCAREYFLWMKKKCSFENNLHEGLIQRDLMLQSDVDVEPSTGPKSSSNVGTAHSPADSDVDMEDDITQTDKEHGIHDLIKDEKPEPVSTGAICETEVQDNKNDLQYSRDSTPAQKSSPSVKFRAGTESQPKKPASQPTNIHSPFRLIQNYASDDSSDDDGGGEPSRDNVNMVVLPLGKSGALSSHGEMEHDNMNFRSSIISQPAPAHSVKVTKEQEALQGTQGDVVEPITKASPGKYVIDDRDGRAQESNSSIAFHGKYASGSRGIASDSTCKDVEKEDKKNPPTAVKVDEFGRLVKEGASESESDDARNLRRRGRRDRSRSHSRSRSPSDRRRRRSPRKRKERRSRSRSWSPKRRRSRSKSPYRPGGDFRGEKLGRGKVEMRECFDFLKGRCFRGASCRYLHHEPDKIENSRRYSSKQHQSDIIRSVRNSDFHGGSVAKKTPPEHNSAKGEKKHLDLDKHDSRDSTSQKCYERSNTEFINDAMLPSVSHQDVQKLVTDVKKCAGTGKEDECPGASDEPTSHPICEDHPSSGVPPTNFEVIHPQAAGFAGAHHRHDEEPQNMDNSLKVDSSAMQTSALPPLSGFSVNEPYPDKISNESAPDFSHHVSHLPPPPLPEQATNAPQGPNSHLDYNVLASSVSISPQSAPIGSGPSYQAPLPNQQSHYPVPPNFSWSTMSQPHPPHMVSSSMLGTPLQFQQGNFPLRNDFPGQMSMRAHPAELPNHSQVSGFPHQTYHLPSSSIPAEPLAGPNLARDDRYSQFSTQNLVPSSSFVPGLPSQPVPFQGDSAVKNSLSYAGENISVAESSKSSFQNHQFAQQRLPPYGPHLTTSESMSSHLGGSLSLRGYSSNPLDRDNASNVIDAGGSRISDHYNPYASTFDQPLSTRFSSIAFTQEREASAGAKYDSSFGLSHAPADTQTAGEYGPRQIMSSSNSSKAGAQSLPKSGGDQYDPLFDSIDPISESVKKRARKQDHAADNSDIMLKLSSRHNILDIEENNRQKVFGAVAATTSLENDEFGETADAEVGAVENASPSDPNDDAIIAEGDIEIDQVKPEGRSKKNKDSRSMKLFKAAVANFVKDVLKPQWRQGNMSKEVFKTIVKKTVDKVSGAMKNHRLPKSQEKIDHYIDSSRRKLTQLVEFTLMSFGGGSFFMGRKAFRKGTCCNHLPLIIPSPILIPKSYRHVRQCCLSGLDKFFHSRGKIA